DDEERAKIPGREMVNQSHPLVIEIWNLVFMQFNRKANGSLEPLPQNHVDTGMGFERLCMILQNKKSNYDTDVFQPTISRISQMSGKIYGEDAKCDVAMRVIADHLRAIAFSIADGQLPSNVKAGYVIRRILRRAVRYGYTYLGFTEPFICRLVDGLSDQLGAQYPELPAQKELIKSVICEEEASFLKTLATGINLLDGVMKGVKERGENVIGGKDAFVLYDTYGFPIDLTELIARENGLEVDLDGFGAELEQQKARSRNAAAIDTEDWVELMPSTECEFVGYDYLETEVKISRYRKVTTKGKTFYQLVFDRTPFYANSGGQLGDCGYIKSLDEKIDIVDTQKENNLPIHIATTLPEKPEATFMAVVNKERRQRSANNHTATHLLDEALRAVLGTHVEQKGSLVCCDYLRFDFSHFQKVTEEQLREVEKLVNSYIRANYPLEENRESTIEEAQKQGAIMLFGEKYGDVVRTVRFGDSIELCGGTHTSATGNIGMFKIISEGAISAGVRRIEAVTGEKAEEQMYVFEDTMRGIQQVVNSPKVLQAVKKLLDENAEMKHAVEQAAKEKVKALVDKLCEDLINREENGVIVVARELEVSGAAIKDIAFALRNKLKNLALVIGTKNDGKPSLAVILGDDIVARGLKAGDIVREAAKEINGGGGGQPFFATAGGKNPEGLDKAIAKALVLINEQLNK
ncbi:MAG: alanine--tRNA ligase, partial [Tidjanibacter sp.]|nr:alanine--tRNA ligase [Tidjanibacter sp.]